MMLCISGNFAPLQKLKKNYRRTNGNGCATVGKYEIYIIVHYFILMDAYDGRV